MPVIVVRHADAGSRSQWQGPNRRRPLTTRGRAQAESLAAALAGYRPERILASPFTRCVETVAPLAAAVGLEVEAEEALAEGHGDQAVALARASSGHCVVLCSHGDVIPELLAAVTSDGVDLGPWPRCEKASVWELDGEGGRFRSAAYLPPPSI